MEGLGGALEELVLRELIAEDISQLAVFHKLRELSLLGCKSIRTIESLAQLRRLRNLHLKNTGITDLSPLRGLRGLQYNVEGSPASEGLPYGWLTME